MAASVNWSTWLDALPEYEHDGSARSPVPRLLSPDRQ